MLEETTTSAVLSLTCAIALYEHLVVLILSVLADDLVYGVALVLGLCLTVPDHYASIIESEARDNHCVIMGALAHEHEYEYTKETMDAFLRYAHEEPSGTTRKSTEVADRLSVSLPGKSLQDLIDVADDGSTKHIPSGYYDLDQTLHIAKNLTLIGNESVVIDAKDGHQILEVEKGISVRIKNTAFVNGNGSYGGAISTRAKELVLDKCIFKDNTAYMGSGLFGYGGDISILNSTFNGNIAIKDTISMPYEGKLVLESTEFSNRVGVKDANCLFFIGDSGQLPVSPEEASMYRQKPNEVLEDYSRGIYNKDLELIIDNCSFHDNIAKDGGAAGSDIDVVGNILIANSKFRSNQGEKYSGPRSAGGDSVVITNTNIINNTITIWGPSPGIEIDGASNALIHNCSISGNHYAKGGRTDCGGIMIYDNSSVEIINSTITDNEGNAGGIYIWPDTTVLLKNSSILGNSASDEGEAIYNKGTLNIKDSTLSDNNALNGSSICNLGTLTDTGSLFYRNHAVTGTIFNLGTMVMNGPKISKNTASEDAGAIFNSGSLTINGGMISENTASKGDGEAIKTTGTLNLNGDSYLL